MERIAERAGRAIESRTFPGCVIGYIRSGETAILPFGRHTYGADSPEVTQETVYDCASITKSIPTATLALQLLDEGRFTLESKLTEFVPDYQGGYRDDITIKHLFTYTINGLRMSSFGSVEEIERAVFSLNPEYPPGAHFAYTNLPAFLLGLVLERLCGPLNHAASERIFRPLGMTATTFHPHGVVPTEEGIQDIVHDESARLFAKAGRTVGHAGLFSNVPDLLKFCEHLLSHPDPRLETNYLEGIGKSASLGWQLNEPWMGTKRSAKTFGKTGFTGTSIVCDFERQTALIILSNRVFPKRPADSSAINALRADVCDIVFS